MLARAPPTTCVMRAFLRGGTRDDRRIRLDTRRIPRRAARGGRRAVARRATAPRGAWPPVRVGELEAPAGGARRRGDRVRAPARARPDGGAAPPAVRRRCARGRRQAL